MTTKLWICDWRAENVKKSVAASLKELQLDYIDLMLIHKSVFCNLPEDFEEQRQKGDFHDYIIVPNDPKYRIGYDKDRLKETLTALEEAYDQVRSRRVLLFIGLSAWYWSFYLLL